MKHDYATQDELKKRKREYKREAIKATLQQAAVFAIVALVTVTYVYMFRG